MEDMSEEEIRGLERVHDRLTAERRRNGSRKNYARQGLAEAMEADAQFSITDAPDSSSQKTLRQYLSQRFPNDERFNG